MISLTLNPNIERNVIFDGAPAQSVVGQTHLVRVLVSKYTTLVQAIIQRAGLIPPAILVPKVTDLPKKTCSFLVLQVQTTTSKSAEVGTKRIAVLGASGYTGEEVVRLLAQHQQFEVTALTGESQAGKVKLSNTSYSLGEPPIL
jgi:hypothetical protein